MSKMDNKIELVPSSGNVFADLGLPNVEEKQAQARLVVAINQIIGRQHLSKPQPLAVYTSTIPRFQPCGIINSKASRSNA